MKMSDKLKRFFYVLRCYLADQDPVEKTQLEVKLPKYITKTAAAVYRDGELAGIYWAWRTSEEEMLDDCEEYFEYLKDFANILETKLVKIKIPDGEVIENITLSNSLIKECFYK